MVQCWKQGSMGSLLTTQLCTSLYLCPPPVSTLSLSLFPVTCIHMCTCTHVYVICTYMCIYKCICIHVCIYMYVCIHMCYVLVYSVCICTCGVHIFCINIYIYVFVHICMFIHVCRVTHATFITRFDNISTAS